MDDLQLALARQLNRVTRSAIGGWKVGMTSGAMRDVAGEGVRPFGHILKDRIFDSQVEFSLELVGSIGIETELCFEFGTDVARSADTEEILEAIAAARPAFELNQRRLGDDASLYERIEDNLSQWGIVIGAPVSKWREIEFHDLVVRLSRDDEDLGRVAARAHIDDHFVSLCRLVRSLNEHKTAIRAGECVITGSFNRTTIDGAARYLGDFGDQIGSVEVNFL